MMFAGRRIAVLLLAVGALAAETKAERTDCYGDPLPNGAIARMGTIRLRDYEVSQVAFSPDGKLLASSSWGGMLRVWDATTGKEIHSLSAEQNYYGSFAFAPDSKSLVARGTDRRIRFWDVATGKQIRAFQTPDDVLRIAYSPSGKILAMIGEKTIRLWDGASGKEFRNITAPKKRYRCLAVSPKEEILAVGIEDRTDHIICLWDIATGKEIRTFRGSPREEKREVGISPIHVYSVAFSADGKLLASAGDDAVRLWDLATGKQLHVFAPKCQNMCVVFAPDGKAVASVGFEKQIHLWDVTTGKEIRHYELPFNDARSLAFSPDGKTLAAGDSNRVRLWDSRTGKPILDQLGHSSPVSEIAYSPDGKLLASGSVDQTMRLWDAATGKEVRIFRGHQDHVSSVAFSPDGKTIASGAWDKTVRLWDAAGAKTISTLKFQEWVHTVSFSPNGKTLATGTSNGVFLRQSLSLSEPLTGKEKTVRLEMDAGSDSVVFSPNGKILVSGGDDKKIHLWDVKMSKTIRVLSGHEFGVTSVAISPDARLIASSSSGGPDDTVRLWDAGSGQQIFVLQPNGQVYAVAFSPDGALLVTGGWDHEVHLWDVLTGKEVYAFRGHRGAVRAVAVSPDGRRLASGSSDTSCLVWDMTVPFRPGLASSDRLSDKQRERFWTTLGGTDALAAWRAVYALAAGLDQTVPFLKRRLQTPFADPQQVRRWIADLDSDTFVVREAAQKELEQRGEIVAPALRQSLRNKPTLEARKRLEHLLADITTRVPSGEFLARLRALTVLDRIGTPEARQLLQKLADGVPEARLTREAKAALQRLDARSENKR